MNRRSFLKATATASGGFLLSFYADDLTAVGKNRPGVLADITPKLGNYEANVENISQRKISRYVLSRLRGYGYHRACDVMQLFRKDRNMVLAEPTWIIV